MVDRRHLQDLKPGSRFRVLGANLSGRLVSRNACEALVELDGPERAFEVEGKRVTVPGGRRVAVSLGTEVEPA